MKSNLKYLGIPLAVFAAATLSLASGQWGSISSPPVPVNTLATKATFGAYTSITNAAILLKASSSSVTSGLALKANSDSPSLVDPIHTTTLVAGEMITANDIVYLKTDGKAWKADNTVADTGNGMLGVAMGTYSSTTTATIKTFGLHSSAAAYKVYSTGRPYFLGTGGGSVLAEPAESGNISRVIGWAASKTKLIFKPDTGSVTK